MTAPVTLLMAVHCHQPVGNFGFVFEQAYEKAYEPFLRGLERHRGVRLTLHYSGPLLDWLIAHHPEFIERVRALASCGQIELLASGYYEPILPLLPEADRQGQIALMRAALREHFGVEGRGLWLTERVWEPDLPKTLAKAEIDYTMVDASQFLHAKDQVPAGQQVEGDGFWDVLGSYTATHHGASVRLFPTSKRLRYWLPFQSVERTIAFLRRLRRDDPMAPSPVVGPEGRSGSQEGLVSAGGGPTGGGVVISFADDGEKFGMWPSTHQWVYERGWLEQFFAALEQERDWLATATFQDYVGQRPADGSVVLPAGSYDEMLEWSGGDFRNFFTKYPEANAMQQKMLRLSDTIQSLKIHGSNNAIERAEQKLYAGQCNCAYWHGVFGGLYLSHLRRAVYGNLIEAEHLLDHNSSSGLTLVDADGDGKAQLSLRTETMALLLDPTEGGAVTEWDLYGPRINLLDTLTRREEPYHAKLRAKQLEPAVAGGGMASIHDLLGVKEDNLSSFLVYDDHRRSSFLDYGLNRMPTLEQVARSTWNRERLWAPGLYRWDRAARTKVGAGGVGAAMVREVTPGQIRKSVLMSRTSPIVEHLYELQHSTVPVVVLEWNLGLRDERYVRGVGQRLAAEAFELAESWSGVSLRLQLDPPATLFHFPIETVSESEEGLERTYQGLCVLCCWLVGQARHWQARMNWTVGAA